MRGLWKSVEFDRKKPVEILSATVSIESRSPNVIHATYRMP